MNILTVKCRLDKIVAFSIIIYSIFMLNICNAASLTFIDIREYVEKSSAFELGDFENKLVLQVSDTEYICSDNANDYTVLAEVPKNTENCVVMSFDKNKLLLFKDRVAEADAGRLSNCRWMAGQNIDSFVWYSIKVSDVDFPVDLMFIAKSKLSEAENQKRVEEFYSKCKDLGGEVITHEQYILPIVKAVPGSEMYKLIEMYDRLK